MFNTLGRITDTYRIPLIAIWLIVAVAMVVLVPAFETNDDQTAFLPSDAPSLVSQQVQQNYFPSGTNSGSVLFVFDAGDGNQITSAENYAIIESINTWLMSEEAPSGIMGVQSAVAFPDLEARFTSENGQVTMIIANLSNEVVANNPAETIDTLRLAINDMLPEDVTVYLTGETAIFSEYESVINDTVGIISVVTPVFVVIILLLIYRSPVSVFISLFAITLAYIVVNGVVGILVNNGTMSVSGTTMTLLMTIMLGSGTDYCLFLINRFREEMVENDDSSTATRTTVRRIGEIISGSAGTTTTGFLAMTTAQLGLFNTSGPVLAMGIVASLLAGLTLTPAILSLLGRRAFWPTTLKASKPTVYHRWTSRMVARRPLPVALVIVAIMAPFAIYGVTMDVNYDSLSDMPEDAEAVQGFRVLEDQIGAGNLQPITAMTVIEDGGLLEETARLSAEIEALDGVDAVFSATQPIGVATSYSWTHPYRQSTFRSRRYVHATRRRCPCTNRRTTSHVPRLF